MVDTDKIKSLLPHYAVMLVVVLLTTSILRTVLGEVSLVVEFGVILVIVLAYPFVVRRLGYAPDVWK